MVDSGRKHGPFDFRYPMRRKIAASVWELQRDRDRPGRLEWSVFLARSFPDRRRHDFEALAAYEAYIDAVDRAASPKLLARPAPGKVRAGRGLVGAPPRAKRVPATTSAGVAGQTVSPSPALADWESEGGSVEPDFD